MRDLLLNLVGHMRWADGLFADTLESVPQPDAEAVRLFAHVTSVEHLWYSRIFERQPDHAVWPELSVPESRALAAQHADLFEQLVTNADEAALAAVVNYRNSAGHDYHSTVGEIVTHVAMHGVHHRGQIARRLRSLGITPAYTDYIQFTRRDQ
ncbi:MAG TPA: DinB family protein [Gemmatimonadaceae bacterium]|nr:DinB family protein [Gemmatimonadaceae bacterium]